MRAAAKGMRGRRARLCDYIGNTAAAAKSLKLRGARRTGMMPCVDDEHFMRLAIREAQRALDHDDVPIGAVVVRDGAVAAAARNERERRRDPTAHAEVLALRQAARIFGSWRVLDSTLYVTLEPCAMCAGAIVLARVPRVVFGCPDPKAGAVGSVLDVLGEPRLNHRPGVTGGVLASECAALLTEFFGARRSR